MKTKQIDIFAFIEDGNLGDPVIGETSKYLIENICEKNGIKANIRLHSLFPPNASIDFPFIKRLRRKCGRPKSNIKRMYIYLLFRLYYMLNWKFRKYYSDILKNSDLVVFGGGGMLKYYSQAFWASDWCILNYCHKKNIPVYFNAIGIEGYDDNNFTSRLIKKMLRKTNIAGITTRDDIDSLNKFLPNNQNKVVGDPALFSKELYGSAEKKDIVGINTIRAGIFNVNGFDTNEDDVIDFYCAMIERLDKDNIKWQLFTNGVKSDYKIAEAILKKINVNKTDEILVPRPEQTMELIQTISKYSGVIAGRMHAIIIATSYGIPTVGQIWNEKIKWFSRHIGAESRFFYPDDMKNYDVVYESFKKALLQGNDNLNTDRLKDEAFVELEHCIKKVLLYD